jgi:hypothetical protein
MANCTRAGTRWGPRSRAAWEAEDPPAGVGWGPHRCPDLDWLGQGPRDSRCGRHSCPTSPGRKRDSGSSGTTNPPGTSDSVRSTDRRPWWQARNHHPRGRRQHLDRSDPGRQIAQQPLQNPRLLVHEPGANLVDTTATNRTATDHHRVPQNRWPLTDVDASGPRRRKEKGISLQSELPRSAMARSDIPIAGPVDCGIECRVCGKRDTG